MHPIRPVVDRQRPAKPAVLPEDLHALYGGDLQFPLTTARPYTVANFVTTLDGVVSFSIPGKSGGSEISGFNEGDRFIMGLLRASADAIIVGSHTFHEAGVSHLWTPESVNPQASSLYASYRQKLGKPPRPGLVIVSGSGRIEFAGAVFTAAGARIAIVTSEAGKREIEQRLHAATTSAEIAIVAAAGAATPATIIEAARNRLGAQLLLHEGGPTLLGEFIAAGSLDELFLTLAPQVAGRLHGHSRLGLISGVEFSPKSAPWLSLLSAKQMGDHLFLRYSARPPAD